jgi:hypothetical protein
MQCPSSRILFYLEYLLFFLHIKLLLWFNIFLHLLVLCWIFSYCVISHLRSFMRNYVDISSIIPHFCNIDHSEFFYFSCPGSSPIVLDNLLCHGRMRESTYMSRVELDILLHSFLFVDSYDIPLVLCLFQSLLYLLLHLYS